MTGGRHGRRRGGGGGDVRRLRGVFKHVRNPELSHGGGGVTTTPAAAAARGVVVRESAGVGAGRGNVRADSGVGRGEPVAAVVAAVGSAGDGGSRGRGGRRASETGDLVANAHCALSHGLQLNTEHAV